MVVKSPLREKGSELRPSAPALSAAEGQKADRGGLTVSYEEVSSIFPDRIVKEWEEAPMPDAWAGTLRKFIAGNAGMPRSKRYARSPR